MPILQYRCKSCSHRFEELVKKFDDAVQCPKCGGACERDYTGSMFSSTGKPVKQCSGNCKTCGGCK